MRGILAVGQSLFWYLKIDSPDHGFHVVYNSRITVSDVLYE